MALQENFNTGADDIGNAVTTTNHISQAFTALEGYTLSSIKVKVYKSGATGTVNVKLYAADEAGHPTGSALSTGSFAGSSAVATPGSLIDVTMSPYSIVGGIEYCIVLSMVSNTIYWRADSTQPQFAGGDSVYSVDSGSSWSTFSVYDHVFENYSSATAGDASTVKNVFNSWRQSAVQLYETTPWRRAQSFTTASTFLLDKVSLRMKKAGAGSTGTVYIDIHTVDGSSFPTGSALATGTWDISTGITTTNGQMEDFTGFGSYAMSDATEYAIVMRTDATGDGLASIHRRNSNEWTGGLYSASADGGSSWASFVADAFFQVWGSVAGETHELEGPVPGVGGVDLANPPEVTFQVGYGAGNEAEVPGLGGLSGTAEVTSIYPQGILMTPLPMRVAEHPGKAIDDDYDTQFATIKAYQVFPKMLAGTKEDGEDTFMRETFNGIRQELYHYQNWFDRAHLLPRLVQELGNIVSIQVFDVELYNSDMNNTITISSVTDNLGSGITIAPIPPLPFDLSPRENVEAVVTVNTTGSFSIDASYTFHQSTGETYTIYITGSRIVLFPIRPEAPMREHLIFDTKILIAADGSEQRIANRKAPRSMFEMTIKDERRMMEMLLMDRQAKVCATPAWHEPSFISSVVTSGDSTVNVNTTNYANFYVGGHAIVLQDQYVYDALEISSMTSTSLTFASPTTNDYAVKVQVMPLMVAYFNHSIASAKNIYNEQTFNLQLKVDATDNDIADSSAFNTYDSKVFLDGPNLVEGGQLSEVMEKKVLVLDNITGAFEEFSQWDRSKRRSNKGFKTNSRQELWELRQLLHYLKGKQVSFYIPTFTKDLYPNQTLVNANSTITMDNIGYTINARDRAPKDFFRILLKDGTELTRTVVGSAEVSTAVEQLTVDSPWPYDIEPGDIERIDFLEKVRINVDDVVITHYNALGQTRTSIPTKEVFD